MHSGHCWLGKGHGRKTAAGKVHYEKAHSGKAFF